MDKKVVILIACIAIISFLFKGIIFAPLNDVYYKFLSKKDSELYTLAYSKALDEITGKSFEEIHSDKFIVKVNNVEVLCSVYCDKGPSYRYYAGIIPYHKDEDLVGPIYDSNKNIIMRKIAIKVSPHGNSKFEESVRTYIVAPNEEGYCVLEPFESFEERQKKRVEQEKKQKEEERKAVEEQKKKDEDSKIRRI
ncbi:MAG: hypothetical protein K6E80_05965 [Schwartzia sp.]|nr:hypothetical protein [Schwartzia sp. (in: firmicutes)]